MKLSASGRLQPEAGDRIRTTTYSELEDRGVGLAGTVTGVSGTQRLMTTDDVDYVMSGRSLQLPAGRLISAHLETRPAAALMTPAEQLRTVSQTTVSL